MKMKPTSTLPTEKDIPSILLKQLSQHELKQRKYKRQTIKQTHENKLDRVRGGCLGA